MAINFPNSPSDGDIFGNYTYDDSIPGWRKTPENSASLPAGTIVQWPGASAPANWLICDGAAVSRTEYASLFAAIGVQYGAGNGTTTFNLPNLKGRVAVGFDASQSEFDVLGETGGAKTHTLTTSEMPSHTHTGTTSSDGAHTHTFSGTTSTDGSHQHTGARGGTSALVLTQTAAGDGGVANRWHLADGSSGGVGILGTLAAGSHSHTYSGTTSGVSTNHTHTFTTSSVGSGEAHNNLQPYIVLNYIIKTSAGITSGDSELATRVGVVENQNNLTPMSYNYIINGAFDIWQRGASISGLGYGADMWYAPFSTSTVSRSTDAPEGFKYSLNVSRSAGTVNYVLQRIEANNSSLLVGKTVTASFWAKNIGSDESIEVSLFSADAVDNFSSTTTIGSAVVLASSGFSTSWTKYSATFNNLPASVANGMHIQIVGRTEASSSGHSFLLAGVQLEEGSYATPFRRNSPSIQSELAACQRYYWRVTAGVIGAKMGVGYGGNSSTPNYSLQHQMRVTPHTLDSSALNTFTARNGDATVAVAITSLTLATQMNEFYILYNATHSGIAGVSNAPNYLRASTADAYIGLSAEL